jgi:hypothetical protein
LRCLSPLSSSVPDRPEPCPRSTPLVSVWRRFCGSPCAEGSIDPACPSAGKQTGKQGRGENSCGAGRASMCSRLHPRGGPAGPPAPLLLQATRRPPLSASSCSVMPSVAAPLVSPSALSLRVLPGVGVPHFRLQCLCICHSRPACGHTLRHRPPPGPGQEVGEPRAVVPVCQSLAGRP